MRGTSLLPAGLARWCVTYPARLLTAPFPHQTPAQSALIKLDAELMTGREIPQSRLWSLSPCILLFSTPPPRRSLRHTLPKSREAVLPEMRGHLLAEIQPTRNDRWRILRHHLPPPSPHGTPAVDPDEGSTGRNGEQQRRSEPRDPEPARKRRRTGRRDWCRCGSKHCPGGDQGGEVRVEDLWV